MNLFTLYHNENNKKRDLYADLLSLAHLYCNDIFGKNYWMPNKDKGLKTKRQLKYLIPQTLKN